MKKRASAFITENSKLIIIAFLIFSTLFFYGATEVNMESSLSQFETDAPEVKAQDYITQNFTSSNQNQTTTQIIIRNDNVLSQNDLIETLRFQKNLYEDESINKTLANQSQPIISVANLIAINSIQQEKINKIKNLSNQAKDLQKEINKDRKTTIILLNQSREVQIQLDQLNYSYQAGLIDESTYNERRSKLNQNFTEINSQAKEALNSSQYNQYLAIESSLLSLQHQINNLNYKYENNRINQSTYQTKLQEYQTKIKQNYSKVQLLFEYQLDKLDSKLAQISDTKSSLQNFTTPSTSKQITQIDDLNQSQLDKNILAVLNQTQSTDFNPFVLMPLDFDPNTTTSNATMIFAVHQAPNTSEMGQTTGDEITTAQKKIQSISGDYFKDGEIMVMGQGLVSDEIDRSMTDSLRIVLPIAIFLVLLALIIAYKDLLDIFLGLFGILLVLVWTFGSMGLLEIEFNQMFVAIPALLSGLSVDFAIHVFMRHREEREENPNERISTAMKIALTSVGIALIWVTATTIIGFLSNLSSSVPPIREFAIVSSIGIFYALIILGSFIPSLKVELDEFLEKRGLNRKKRAFGTSGVTESFLSSVSTVVKKKPILVIIIALLLTIAAGYGATKVDTSFKEKDFLAEKPAQWMDFLPEQIEPGEYSIKENLDYLNQNFFREDQEAQILIKGNIDSPQLISSLDDVQEVSKNKDSVTKLSNGEARIKSPLTLINQIRKQNQSFNETLNKADTDNDDLPDQDISKIFSELNDIVPEESSGLIYETDSGYEAVRTIISVKGTANTENITKDMREIADQISEQKELNATATGSTVVFNVIETQIFDTVIQSLFIALVAVLAFISVAFKLIEGNAKLGIITILPVLFIVTWIVGTMYALDIPFNIMTASVTNLTIGLGIDYSIHISERFKHEIDEKQRDLGIAMEKTITGTGGALLGTAATTIGGFGVLSIAILPVLKQFGIITAITMLYSFIAGIFLLPSLLILWARSKEGIREKKTDSETPIVIKNLSKTYGKTKALKDMNLEIQREGVYGLLGPNGAGKTTLMNILAGAIKRYKGEVKIFGKEIKNSSEIKQKIGYLPENTGYYKDMTGYNFLKHLSKLSGLSEYESSKRAYKWIERVGLEGWGDKKISNYSEGMKKKLGFAQAFIHDPEIILLDEPTAKLDPLAREEVLDLIKGYSENKIILLTTTDLEGVNEALDNVSVLKDGRIIDQETIGEISDLERYYKGLIEE